MDVRMVVQRHWLTKDGGGGGGGSGTPGKAGPKEEAAVMERAEDCCLMRVQTE